MEKLLLLPGIWLTLLDLISPGSAQYLPPIACPQFFDYLSFNGQFIGHISIEHDPLFEENNLVVEFSQRGAYDWVGNQIYIQYKVHSIIIILLCSYHTLTPRINSLLGKTQSQ